MAMCESEKVIRTLYGISTEADKGFEYQILKLLEMGCERFKLDIGILSKIVGDTYTVVHKVCPADIPLNVGDEFALGNTYCSITLQADKPVAYEHVEQSEICNHPAYKNFALESYVGIPIFVDGVRFGTLNFSSPYPMQRKFSGVDVDTLQLMASWISAELLRIENVRQLEEANARLKEQASKDSLTNLYNRRFFQETLQHLLGLTRRDGMPLSLILVDVDYFKQYNDSFGHLEGDQVLLEFSRVLLGHCRASDYVVRFGGDEFAVLLPATDKQGAVHYANELRESIENAYWPRHKVTASFGVATLHDTGNDESSVVALGNKIISDADDALYDAKFNGRNQVAQFNVLNSALTGGELAS